MLLTIDVGNTNITLGVFENETLKGTFRMTTKRSRTSDEYGFNICGILEHRNIMPQDIKDVIIASVVPDIMHSLTSGIIKYLNIKPIIVSAGIKTGIRIVTENPKESDRIGSSMRWQGMNNTADRSLSSISERRRLTT